jgi:putative transcriptional regulator
MPMTETELQKRGAQRDLGAELLASVRQMAARKGGVVMSPVISARKKSGLSQTEFAKLLGVSVRTLQDWEQGRRQPSGAAKTLITIAERRPEVLREAAMIWMTGCITTIMTAPIRERCVAVAHPFKR